MRIRKEQKSKKRRLRLKCLLLAAVLIAALLGTDAQLRPAIAAAAGSQANLYATQAIQEAVFQEMEGLELEYGDLVRLTYSDQGSVTSLQTDMLAMSRLQSAVTTSVIESILRFSSQQVTLPAGSLTGNPFFSGRGPEVEIRLIPAGFVQTQMKNVFESAGINQTRHQILLNVRLDIQAVLPGYAIANQVDTDICLAETVIVGLVPDYGAGED